MDWLGLRAAELIAAVGIILVWVLAAIAYIEGLRFLLASREQALHDALRGLAESLTSDYMRLQRLSTPIGRDHSAAVQQLIEELESEGRLREKMAALDDSPLFLGDSSLPPATGTGDAGEPLQALAAARLRVEEAAIRYNSAAADAAFVSERPPLSFLASVAGLAARPLLPRRRVARQLRTQ